MAFRRGEIHTYSPALPRPGQSLLRLVLTAEGLNDSPIPVVIGVQVVDRDPGSLLAVQLAGHGWAVVTTIEPVLKRRLGELVGGASTEEMAAVDQALRAALDLD